MAKVLKPDAALRRLKEFDFARARVSLWVFKKRAAADQPLSFSAVWVDTAPPLTAELKAIARETRDAFTEASEYGLLQQPNDEELLVLATAATEFPRLEAAIVDREEKKQAKTHKDLDNAAGYLVRITANSQTIICVRKSTSDWKTVKSASLVNLIFAEQQLDIAQDPVFRIARTFDFFATDGLLLVANKRAFEALLNFKSMYENSFTELRSEKEFIELFTDMQPLQDYVSTNAMQLRRMAVVRDRGYYKDPQYIARLQSINVQRKWGIHFDTDGRITPTNETARVILQVLLNHRLFSELSLTTYDVPSTTPV